MTEAAPDHAPVRVVAPIVFAAAFVLGALLQRLIPLPTLAGPPRFTLGAVLIAIGLAIGFGALRVMNRAGTSPNPYVASAALVEDWPFRFSRNPMYVSMVLIFAGLAVLLRQTLALIALVPAVFVIQGAVIAPEERYLAQRFGASYAAYRARVRRWL